MALFERNPSRPSNNYSTVTFAVFLALVLVGVWMLTSSTSLQSKESAQETQDRPIDVPSITEDDTNTGTSNESQNGNGEDKTHNVNTKGGTENKPGEDTKTETENKPSEDTKGETGNKAGEDTKGETESKPSEDTNGETENKPSEDTKAETESKPSEDTKGETESKPSEDTNGETENKPSEDTKGETENKPSEDTKGETENKPSEDTKAETENKPSEDTKAETESKPSEDTNGETENKPSEDTKSETENKPGEDTNGETENKPSEDTNGEIENKPNEDTNDENETKTNEDINGTEETNVETENNGTEDTKSETETSTTKFDDENGKTEGGELAKQDENENDTTNSNEEKTTEKFDETNTNSTTTTSEDVFPNGAQSELLNETSTQNSTFSTQADESTKEKEVQESEKGNEKEGGEVVGWKLCASSAGPDYIPCLDNEAVIKKLKTTKHYEHRERHCPDEPPTCLVPLPEGYKRPIDWPHSRDKIWYHNVPHTKLADVKGHQNWVKVSGEYLSFPGGGTQFTKGALHYIDTIQESFADIAWGKKTRVVLDVGCGVASFGGFLFEREVLTMSFAPKDEHEAQVQFALERGIPAISAVMGTKRLPYPSLSFDAIHCARCRVPWHIEGGMLLLELNRLLRPGGYFVWSATPVYQKLEEDVEIWNAMSELMKSMCWKMVKKTKDTLNKVGLAIYQKPSNNKCYNERPGNSTPPMCPQSDDPNAAWNVTLQACMHKIPDSTQRGAQWPEKWPTRLETSPYWMNESEIGVYGKPAPRDFEEDYQHWKRVVSNSYVNGMGIDWSHVRNVMDMRAVYGGFAAALSDMKVWVMNTVPIDSADTLPIIYERGLFGMYHDWCESFSTYPRSYDLLHADHVFSRIRNRCKIEGLMAEVDRVLRPEGKLIVRDNAETISDIENIAKSLKYEIRMTYSKGKEGLLYIQKTMWHPTEIDDGSAPLS